MNVVHRCLAVFFLFLLTMGMCYAKPEIMLGRKFLQTENYDYIDKERSIVIEGKGFDGAVEVYFNGTPSEAYAVFSAEKIMATPPVPMGINDAMDVTVETKSEGTSDIYKYNPDDVKTKQGEL
jgi:hypothetical protein